MLFEEARAWHKMFMVFMDLLANLQHTETRVLIDERWWSSDDNHFGPSQHFPSGIRTSVFEEIASGEIYRVLMMNQWPSSEPL